jgi:hypothetical protein
MARRFTGCSRAATRRTGTADRERIIEDAVEGFPGGIIIGLLLLVPVLSRFILVISTIHPRLTALANYPGLLTIVIRIIG